MNSIFEGNLGNTPELRFTGQGAQAQAVTTLRVCSNRRRRLEDGSYETVDELWLNIEVWGRQAESCAKTLRKGAPLLIVGDLRDNSYEKDGKRIASVKLVAQHVGLNLGRVDTLAYEMRRAANDSLSTPQRTAASEATNAGKVENATSADPPYEDAFPLHEERGPEEHPT